MPFAVPNFHINFVLATTVPSCTYRVDFEFERLESISSVDNHLVRDVLWSQIFKQSVALFLKSTPNLCNCIECIFLLAVSFLEGLVFGRRDNAEIRVVLAVFSFKIGLDEFISKSI